MYLKLYTKQNIIIVLNINYLIRILLKVSNNSQPIKYMYI